MMFWRRNNRKKLYIPFQEEGFGGVNTFLKNLHTYLDKVKFPYTNNPDDASAIFFPVATDINVIKKIKSKGGKVIQRLDGIYYPSQHGEDYYKLNEPIKEIYLNYTDFVVFQAEYSKKQCFFMLGEKPAAQYTLIPNGVNISVFFPSAEKNLSNKLRFVSTGNFRKLLMIEPIVKALDKLEADGVLFEYHIIGKTIPELELLLNKKYITLHGEKDLEYIAQELRNSDIFLHSQLNDNCPNSVLEAVATGIPVVAFNSGGVKELLSFSFDTLVDVNSNELINIADDLDFEKYYQKLLYTIKNYQDIHNRYREHIGNYSLEVMGASYVKVFNQFI